MVDHADTHDSEELAAAFLGGELSPVARSDFEQHLLGCESCWSEVELARTGRHWAEAAREIAPLALRDRLRAVVADAPSPFAPAATVTEPKRVRPLRRVSLAALAAAAAVLAVVAVPAVLPDRAAEPAQPYAIAQAVAGFRADRLPGAELPSDRAPDLAVLGLRPVGAASGDVGGTSVTAFAYRDSAGRDLMVYLSREPFPTARGAVRLAGADGPWVAASEGITVLCARSPHALLVLSEDRALVLATAKEMRLV